MGNFNISKHPTGVGHLCSNQVRFELYVDTSKDVRLEISDKNSLGDGKVTIIGAQELWEFAEGILCYLKEVSNE